MDMGVSNNSDHLNIIRKLSGWFFVPGFQSQFQSLRAGKEEDTNNNNNSMFDDDLVFGDTLDGRLDETVLVLSNPRSVHVFQSKSGIDQDDLLSTVNATTRRERAHLTNIRLSKTTIHSTRISLSYSSALAAASFSGSIPVGGLDMHSKPRIHG